MAVVEFLPYRAGVECRARAPPLESHRRAPSCTRNAHRVDVRLAGIPQNTIGEAEAVDERCEAGAVIDRLSVRSGEAEAVCFYVS